jgi:hypothetical protein
MNAKCATIDGMYGRCRVLSTKKCSVASDVKWKPYTRK